MTPGQATKHSKIIELEQNLRFQDLKLIYAAEAGSRAWGFASPDSDYDVRFVFGNQRFNYLSLKDPVSDLRWDFPGDIDCSGWDLKKTLQLAEASNPSLIEWLGSPVVYYDGCNFRRNLTELMMEFFSPRRLGLHYLNFMANMKKKPEEEQLGEYTMKRYLYALRPILVILWMRDNPLHLPPVPFRDLLVVPEAGAIMPSIEQLLELKSKAAEKTDYQDFVLDAAVEALGTVAAGVVAGLPEREFYPGALDALFRHTLSTWL